MGAQEAGGISPHSTSQGMQNSFLMRQINDGLEARERDHNDRHGSGRKPRQVQTYSIWYIASLMGQR